MSKGEYRRNRTPIFPGQPDPNFVAQAFDQVSKPDSRLGEQMMTPSCHEQKPVEFIDKLFRPTGLVRKLFPFCNSDFALKRILVQPSEKLLRTRCYIKLVELVRMSWLQTIFRNPNFL